MKNYTHLFPLVMALVFLHSVARSQTCPSGSTSISTYTNTYYPGTQATVAAGATSITVGAAGYGTTPISQYDIVLIIQMQGAQINSTNGPTYGDGATSSGYLNNAQLMAGRMEYAIAANNVPVAGGTLTLQTGLTNSYKNANFGTDGQYRYQIIRVPLYYNATLNASILAPIWNGAVGGVIVLYVSNTLNMNGNSIDASSAGFRGGGGKAYSSAGSTASNSDYLDAVLTGTGGKSGGSKGEGIAGTPDFLYYFNSPSMLATGVEGYPNGSLDRGAPGNAGGGATDGQPSSNSNNAGGGGGGNGGGGGIGGNSWSSNFATGGKPGAPFAQQTPSRLVMGGGGGAGSSDGGTGTPGGGYASSGAPGGGIVLITASSITGTGSVLANGAPPNGSLQNDGSGGGGAGGSVLIVTGTASPTLTVQAKGSDGASNTGTSSSSGGQKHGPGGGGGGGIVYSNKALGSVSVTGGAAGLTTTLATPTVYGNAPGSAGISSQSISLSQIPPFPVICNGLLSIESISATASSDNGTTDIVWQTISQTTALQYDVERSLDNANFSTIATIIPQTDNNEYHYKDATSNVSNTRYYRIREKDIDDTWLYSNVIAIRPTLSFFKPMITPNPASSSATLRFASDRSSVVSIRLIDVTGAPVWNSQYRASEGSNTVSIDQLQHLPTGMYILQLNDGEKASAMKMFIRH